MSDYGRTEINSQELDNAITGHYGEDQFRGEPENDDREAFDSLIAFRVRFRAPDRDAATEFLAALAAGIEEGDVSVDSLTALSEVDDNITFLGLRQAAISLD